MSTLNTEQRDALPESDFGDPKGRRFPILDQSDVDAAARLIGRAKGIDQEAVKKRIIAIARRKNLKPPDAWVQQPAAAMSADDSAEYVEREGPIFESGDYPQQGINVTPEDLLAMEADFQPVDIELQHYDSNGQPNILSGKLGQLVGVSVAENGTTLMGRTRIPKWLHGMYEGDPLKPSVVIDTATKQLARLGLVLKPQVTTAALFSAYAQFAGARHSSADQADMQAIHDLTMKQGAMCSPDNCPSGAPGVGVGVGAGSAQYSQQSKEKKKMTLKERWNAFINGKTEEDLAAITPEQLAEFAKADPPPAAPATPPQTQGQAPQPNPEIEALRKQVAQFAADKRVAQATQKVEALIHAGKLYPAESAYALATFTRAMEDDETNPGLVTFSQADGKSVQATRVQALEAQYQARPAHNLTKEAVAVFALPAQDGSAAEAEAKKRKEKLLSMTSVGQEVIKSRNGNGAH